MVSINIEIERSEMEDLERKLGGLEEAIKAIRPVIAERVYARILELAESELNTSFDAYAKALKIDKRKHEVVLDARKKETRLAWQIEHGTAGGDMRESLGPGETYRHVAFKHGAPRSKSKKVPSMGSGYRHFGWTERSAKQMGREAYAAAKSLESGDSVTGLKHPPAAPHHKYGLYDRMRRTVTGPQGGRSSYTTFRTMSIDEPNGWIYPPRDGRHFFERVQGADMDTYIRESIEQILKK